MSVAGSSSRRAQTTACPARARHQCEHSGQPAEQNQQYRRSMTRWTARRSTFQISPVCGLCLPCPTMWSSAAVPQGGVQKVEWIGGDFDADRHGRSLEGGEVAPVHTVALIRSSTEPAEMRCTSVFWITAAAPSRPAAAALGSRGSSCPSCALGYVARRCRPASPLPMAIAVALRRASGAVFATTRAGCRPTSSSISRSAAKPIISRRMSAWGASRPSCAGSSGHRSSFRYQVGENNQTRRPQWRHGRLRPIFSTISAQTGRLRTRLA